MDNEDAYVKEFQAEDIEAEPNKQPELVKETKKEPQIPPQQQPAPSN